MSEILSLGKAGSGLLEVQGQFGLCGKCQASQSYVVRPYLKNKTKQLKHYAISRVKVSFVYWNWENENLLKEFQAQQHEFQRRRRRLSWPVILFLTGSVSYGPTALGLMRPFCQLGSSSVSFSRPSHSRLPVEQISSLLTFPKRFSILALLLLLLVN